jgi:Trk-type K+ transport system membrane component
MIAIHHRLIYNLYKCKESKGYFMRFLKTFFLVLLVILLVGLISISLLDVNIPQTEKNETLNISLKAQ